MPIFLNENEINAEIGKILEQPKTHIVIISPFIKLHDRYISILKTHIENPNIKIIVVFGKNKNDISKSMKEEDFNFFKAFSNIEIRYEERLHAKYYANDHKSIITSMNLHGHSHDNNIEVGVLSQFSFFWKLIKGKRSFEQHAYGYFERVIEQSKLLYHNSPIITKNWIGREKKTKESKIEVDDLSDFFLNKTETKKKSSTYKNTNKNAGAIKSTNEKKLGFCIRTATPIPLNADFPLCSDSYKSWVKFEDENYEEKYDHFTGEKSDGKTSKAKPILKKNYSKYMAEMKTRT